MRSRRGLIVALASLMILVLLMISLVLQFQLPQPTGPYTVGRTSRSWEDVSRQEVLGSEDDLRAIPVVIWYPAQTGTGSKMPYYPALEEVAAGLVDSGEISAVETFGLRLIRSQERMEAEMTEGQNRYPVVLLSPGNGTNVEFYDSIAGELASHGYIIVGVNHPYDVAAVVVQNGRVAKFVQGPMNFSEREEWTVNRIKERTTDLLFVLEKL